MVSFIGNNIKPKGKGLIPFSKVLLRRLKTVIGNGSGLFSGGAIAKFSDGAYTGASARSVDYGGAWTDFGSGVPPIVQIGSRLFLQSELAVENKHIRVREFDNAAWTKTNSTIAANDATGPDGNATADKVVENNDVAQRHHAKRDYNTDGSSPYCMSCYAKADERSWLYFLMNTAGFPAHITCYYDIANNIIGTDGGNLDTSGIEASANNYSRPYYSATSDAAAATPSGYELANGDNGITYNGDGSSGLHLFNSQLEIGQYPSSPINSGAVATTRAKDEFVWLSADVPDALRGAFSFVWIAYWGSDYLDDITFCEFDESGASHNIRVWYDATDQKIYVTDETGSSTLVSSDALTITRGDVITISPDPAAGSITVSGATAGNGTNVDTGWVTTAGDVCWGANKLGGEQCLGLISQPE